MRELTMEKEEKVLYLTRLAVDTYNSYRSAQISSGRNLSDPHDPVEEIEKIYAKFEVFLDQKLSEDEWK
jgi:hypothetical protein